MRKRLLLAVTTVVALLASVLVFGQPAHAAVGLRISGGRIVEANGTPFVMRGVSHPHVWYTSQTSSFAGIKSLGANTVRVVLSSGTRGTPSTDVANVVALCKQNRLICVLEDHDTTGYGEVDGAASLDQAVTYWISQKDALVGQENYVVINIGNEPFGNNASVSATWPTATSNAIKRLRDNGLEHLIMVDAPMWGQDWQHIMRDNAPAVFASDPHRNTVFSIHMYGVYDTSGEVTDYLGRFQDAGLPLVIGEFGHDHSDGNPDENTIMAQAQARGIGYIGWSWSGNGGGVEYLDMVTNFDASRLTPWGERFFNGANGVRATSREATIYRGPPTSPPIPSDPVPSIPTPSNPTPTSPGLPPVPPGCLTGGEVAVLTTCPPRPPSSPSTPPPGGKTCTAAYTVQNQWPGGFQGDVRITAGRTAIRGWTVTWTFANGQSISHAWGATVTRNGSSVTARNATWNGRLGAEANTNLGFIGTWNGTNSVPAVSCTAS